MKTEDIMTTGTWFEIKPSAEFLKKYSNRKMPAWAKQFFIADNGSAFLPAALFNNENAVFLCASYDGASICYEGKHLYVDSEWARQEYPGVFKSHPKLDEHIKAARKRMGHNET